MSTFIAAKHCITSKRPFQWAWTSISVTFNYYKKSNYLFRKHATTERISWQLAFIALIDEFRSVTWCWLEVCKKHTHVCPMFTVIGGGAETTLFEPLTKLLTIRNFYYKYFAVIGIIASPLWETNWAQSSQTTLKSQPANLVTQLQSQACREALRIRWDYSQKY